MVKNVKIIFLGGVGEIGRNMTALECGDDIIVIDAGLGFADAIEMPGIDYVAQDLTYLLKNKNKVRAYVVTHGHEDHIGAMPYVLGQVPATIYGSRITLALIDNKLREHKGIKVKAVSVRPRSVVTIGSFNIEFIHVNHSIPGCFALSITTPVGIIFHSGDFKIDFTPVDGNPMDLTRIGEIGKKGVALMLCESTNVERKGFTLSETSVGEKMEELFVKNMEKRLFVATFASNVHRVQQLLDLATKYKRKVAFAGRSMINVSDIAIKLGEMRPVEKNQIIDIVQVPNHAEKDVLVVLTGSQGEPGSALQRMSIGDFNKIHIGPKDTVILSSSPIPGNEKAVNNVVNRLIHRGAHVVYESLAEVHVSGHACEEEIKILHALVKPTYLIPVHGEHKHLKKHAALAVRLGMHKRNIAIAELGEVWELSPNSLKKLGSVPSNEVLIDGSGQCTIESPVLRDRQVMQDSGICVIGIGYNKQSGAVIDELRIATKGLLYQNEHDFYIPELRTLLLGIIAKVGFGDENETRNELRRATQSFFSEKLKRRPAVISMLNAL